MPPILRVLGLRRRRVRVSGVVRVRARRLLHLQREAAAVRVGAAEADAVLVPAAAAGPAEAAEAAAAAAEARGAAAAAGLSRRAAAAAGARAASPRPFRSRRSSRAWCRAAA